MIEQVVETLTKIKEEDLDKFAQVLFTSKSNRIFLIGNGGSASTASHFASDLLSLNFNATCLSDNISRVTAIANDYGWNDIFIKQLQHIKKGDVLIAISVHGGYLDWSNNLVKATMFAKGRVAKTLSLVGNDGGELAQICDFSIIVPSDSTPIIEGLHSVLTHIICEKVKQK